MLNGRRVRNGVRIEARGGRKVTPVWGELIEVGVEIVRLGAFV